MQVREHMDVDPYKPCLFSVGSFCTIFFPVHIYISPASITCTMLNQMSSKQPKYDKQAKFFSLVQLCREVITITLHFWYGTNMLQLRLPHFMLSYRQIFSYQPLYTHAINCAFKFHCSQQDGIPRVFHCIFDLEVFGPGTCFVMFQYLVNLYRKTKDKPQGEMLPCY